MSKIRINELARELEVKPGVIIDLLPDLGVEEKKTHSSSLDDDLAELVRKNLSKGAEAEKAPAKKAAPNVQAAPPAEEPEPAAPPVVEAAKPKEKESASAAAADEPAPAGPIGGGAPIAPPLQAPGSAHPIRPPLAGARTSVPSIPIPPRSRPVAPPRPPIAPSRQASASAPAIRPPGVPVTPAPTPAAPSAAPSPAVPAAPVSRTSPLVSGPRQPLPAGMPERPAMAAPGAPAMPRPPIQPRVPLAGQPSERPVVPPKPEILARLARTQVRTPGPGQPAPGRPSGRSGGPQPGQPIYRGPLRPGQPVVRGPGLGGAPGGPPRPGRGRGPHPTAPLPSEPAPAPDATRRHQTKPRGPQRDRTKDQEGRMRPTTKRQEVEVVAKNAEITISEGVTVKELAEKMGVKASVVIARLVQKKIFATINQTLDAKLAEELAAMFGSNVSHSTFEAETTQDVDLTEIETDMVRRAPVVTVMGHVDHGKTSLLDAIRKADVAGGEAGGITQHIGAYEIHHNDRKTVFIDTPGHEAFTRMRARGAKVTDIVILVVAADDGVMPQTREAIDHARAAAVPLIVAINKIDKPEAQIDRIKQQLNELNLLAEDWGGDTVMVPVSAKAKQNLDLLLDMIHLVADMQDLKANPARPALCTVLEAKLDRGRGPVATVLVRNGTLRVGDDFICGTVFSRVRAMFDDHGEAVDVAEPSTPVEVLGFEELPEVGDTLQVVTDTVKAKQIVEFREVKAREVAMAKGRVSLEKLHQQLTEGETKELNIILKADVGGSAEVLADSLQKLSTEKVKIRVIHSGVGAITETDVQLATASEAIVIGFNVRPERSAAQLAEQEKVDVRLHTIIYDLTQEIKNAMTGLLEPILKEVYKGRADVRDTFRITKVGTVAGCYITDGNIPRGAEVRLLRDNVVVHTGKIEGLRRFKDEVSEVKTGFECGINLANYNDVKPGDVLEAFVTEKIAQGL